MAGGTDAMPSGVPVLDVGSVRRISGRLFYSARSTNEKIVRVERDALTGAILLRGSTPGRTEVLLERVNHPLPLLLPVEVRVRAKGKSGASKERRADRAAPILVLPGWSEAGNFTAK